LYIGVPVDATNPATWSEDALIVAAAVWSPCYFTGWTSANHWALTDQVFRTTVLKTTGRVRAANVRLLDHDYLIGHAADAALGWGMKSEWRAETRLGFADPARTVVDVLDDPSLAGGIRHAAEITAAYLDEHEPATLVGYGERLGNHAVFKRLGFVVEALGLEAPDLEAACRERISAGISALDPTGPEGGRRVMRWGLRVNVGLGKQEPS
jgi:predicted transcriptional regulator of viral defense system